MNVSPTRRGATADRVSCRAKRDPDRWFDRTNRTHALAGCLACPARSWCARQALAGSRLLGDVGRDLDRRQPRRRRALSARDRASRAAEDSPAGHTYAHRIEAPRRPPAIRPPAKHTVAAVITARSSGHCEIMAPDCLLGLEAIASRIRGRAWHELPDAAAGYAVCRTCQAAVDADGAAAVVPARLPRRQPRERSHRAVLLAPKPLDALGFGGRGSAVLVGAAQRMRPELLLRNAPLTAQTDRHFSSPLIGRR